MKPSLVTFLIFMVCSSVLIKPKKKCDCVTQQVIYRNGKVIHVDYTDVGKNFTEIQNSEINVSGKNMICDSITWKGVNIY